MQHDHLDLGFAVLTSERETPTHHFCRENIPLVISFSDKCGEMPTACTINARSALPRTLSHDLQREHNFVPTHVICLAGHDLIMYVIASVGSTWHVKVFDGIHCPGNASLSASSTHLNRKYALIYFPPPHVGAVPLVTMPTTSRSGSFNDR
jgi:hypothetical protein